MDKNLEFILKQQLWNASYASNLFEIIYFKSNKSERLRGGILSTLLDCFNYGIIIGKRMERLKKKSSL